MRVEAFSRTSAPLASCVAVKNVDPRMMMLEDAAEAVMVVVCEPNAATMAPSVASE